MTGEHFGDSTASAVLASHHAPNESAFIRWISPVFGKTTGLVDSATSLGRDDACTAVLPGPNVSRRHAEIVKRGPVHLLRDCDSKNGVFVNGRRVAEWPLSAGQLIRLGDWLGIVTVAERAQHASTTIDRYGDGLYVGPGFALTLAPARAVAPSEIPVIIEGPTGSGKERVARAIHTWSGRKGAFVAVNCAAIPDALAEAEFFGYRKGAFTGAEAAALGHVRAASGGTLLLDEVSDLPAGIQVKLLRMLQEQEVSPLGETRPTKVDVRVIAATQVPLGTLVQQGKFRADLWARLNGLTVRLPPLLERREEIPFLFLRMLEEAGGSAVSATADCLERLCLHSWPLNLRELAALAKRISVIHAGERQLTVRHLIDFPPPGERPATPAADDRPRNARFLRAFPSHEISALRTALAQHENNLTRAAAALNITRARAYRLLEAAGRVPSDDAITD